jgi:hypothetical protein
MTEEEKEILLKDLCGRLHYRVLVSYKGLIYPLFSVVPTQHFQITLDSSKYCGLVHISLDDDGEKPKPYLRPMSSMTEEEKREYFSFIGGVRPFDCDFSAYPIEYKFVYEHDINSYIDWLNKHHFDYRGLIEKGLAIEALEGMYNLKME